MKQPGRSRHIISLILVIASVLPLIFLQFVTTFGFAFRGPTEQTETVWFLFGLAIAGFYLCALYLAIRNRLKPAFLSLALAFFVSVISIIGVQWAESVFRDQKARDSIMAAAESAAAAYPEQLRCNDHLLVLTRHTPEDENFDLQHHRPADQLTYVKSLGHFRTHHTDETCQLSELAADVDYARQQFSACFPAQQAAFDQLLQQLRDAQCPYPDFYKNMRGNKSGPDTVVLDYQTTLERYNNGAQAKPGHLRPALDALQKEFIKRRSKQAVNLIIERRDRLGKPERSIIHGSRDAYLFLHPATESRPEMQRAYVAEGKIWRIYDRPRTEEAVSSKDSGRYISEIKGAGPFDYLSLSATGGKTVNIEQWATATRYQDRAALLFHFSNEKDSVEYLIDEATGWLLSKDETRQTPQGDTETRHYRASLKEPPDLVEVDKQIRAIQRAINPQHKRP